MSDRSEMDLTIISRAGGQTTRQQARAERYDKNGRVYLRYLEPDPEMGRTFTTIRMESEGLRILRQGDIRSEQNFRVGQRTFGSYETPYGRMELETVTKSLVTEVGSRDGRILWEYDLYVEGEPLESFSLSVTMKAVSD